MKEPALLQVSPLNGAVRRVNAPYFDAAMRYSEMAVFWFGRVAPTDNYADVRVGYNSSNSSCISQLSTGASGMTRSLLQRT